MNHKNALKVVDLFAGCGGLSLGLENAGFYPIFVNELNDDARKTYIENRREINPRLAHPEFHAADVKSMLASPSYLRKLKDRFDKEYGIGEGDLDLLVGGPPCQGFSGIGHRRSYSVEKEQLPSNHLFQDMAALVYRLKPKAFLFENVRGLLHAKWNDGGRNGEIWEQVLSTFRGIKGYDVAFKLVLAKNYGVPQNRPRVLLVGIRNDIKSPLLRDGDSLDAVERGFLPMPGAYDPPDPFELLGDLVDDKYENGGVTLTYPKAATTSVQKLLRLPRGGTTPLGKGEPVTEHEYSKHAPRIVSKFEAMIESGGIVPPEYQTKKFAQRVLPRRWGAEGPTITATSLPDDYVHFKQPRILTVREWARLQMFPDWYRFAGKRSTGGIRRAGNPREGVFDREVPKYTQIGNAVPVRLAQAVGEHLAAILKA
jgi:DNA (cytosine-5)-methyltransferase 1